jgi:hypothetical protein
LNGRRFLDTRREFYDILVDKRHAVGSQGPKNRKEVRVAEKVENKPLLDMTWKKQKPLKKEGRK